MIIKNHWHDGKNQVWFIFSFKYSERKGTAAQKLEGKLKNVKSLRRLEQLQMLQDQHTLEKNTAMESSKQELLVWKGKQNSETI